METYLDLCLVYVLRLCGLLVMERDMRRSVWTYQVAHNNLAVASHSTSGGCLLSRGSSLLLRCLSDTADGGDGGSSSSDRAASSSGTSTAATNGATLSGENLVERLVKLSRHIDGFVGEYCFRCWVLWSG